MAMIMGHDPMAGLGAGGAGGMPAGAGAGMGVAGQPPPGSI